MTPHEVLGLPPGACDARTLKKAYAAALKLHRPDRDPAGFARVRAAYETMQRRAAVVDDEEDEAGVDKPQVVVEPATLQDAMAELASLTAEPLATADVQPPAAPPVEPPFLSRLPPAAPPLTAPDPLQALRDLAPTPGGAEGEVLANALRQGFAGLVAGTVTARAWDEAISPFVPLRSQVVTETFSDDDLMDETVHGSGIATATVIEHLFTFAGWDRLCTLGQRWAGRPPSCPSWLSERIIHKLAVHLSVIDYPLANELVLAVGGARGLHFQDNGSLDRSLMLGSELKTASVAVRRFVAELLAGGCDPGSQPRLLTALRKHLAPLPWSSATRQTLGARYPGRFRPLSAPAGTSGSPVTVFVVLVTLITFTVATLVVMIAIAIGPDSAMSAYAAIPIYGGAIWSSFVVHRRLRPWWEQRARPWLSAHIGPFDLRFWMLLLWWQCGPIPWLIDLCDIREWLWWFGIPLAIPLLRLLRWGWRPAASGWRIWLADPGRAGEVAKELDQRHALFSLEGVVLLPVLLLAGMAGTVSNYALAWAGRDTAHTVLTLGMLPIILFGLDAAARVAVAQEQGWRETRKQWLVPVALMALFIGFTALATWLLGKAV